MAEIEVGEACIIENIHCTGATLRRFLDLGMIPGTRVTAVFASPALNPVAYLIRGSVIALRREDCKNIMVSIDKAAAD